MNCSASLALTYTVLALITSFGSARMACKCSGRGTHHLSTSAEYKCVSQSVRKVSSLYLAILYRQYGSSSGRMMSARSTRTG
ncbi:hypothetical protein BDU57DRAFT_517211 [Ampelomyces quisqualis]|uniref:Secreted protein n=1 Tax=Ampelomyces quisqualis TaxID=50730 RepID=A0A6A5QMJ4_AMPQU|nr:hypothetical protein BDU57DRAFT_517211 [Ampelomyces quisqualis]